MTKILFILSMLAIGGSAYASDDEDAPKGCWAGATAAAENYARKHFDFKEPKRAGVPFYSKKGNAIIVLVYDQGDAPSSAKHVAVMLEDEDSCKFGNIFTR